MSKTLQYEVGSWIFTQGTHLVVLSCKTCGIPYAIPNEMNDWAHTHPDVWWYCPNGHRWHYPVRTEEQKIAGLKDRLAAEKARHEQTRASLSATKGVVTKTRKERDRIKARIENGVCPCCNRTFVNLGRHMHSKHPDYASAEA